LGGAASLRRAGKSTGDGEAGGAHGGAETLTARILAPSGGEGHAGFLPVSDDGSLCSVASGPIASRPQDGTGRPRNNFATKRRRLARILHMRSHTLQPVCSQACRLCNQLAHCATYMQACRPPLQSVCKLVGLGCKPYASTQAACASNMQAGSPAHCYRLAHCVTFLQSCGLPSQSTQILATVCTRIAQLRNKFATKRAGFALSLHTHPLALQQACISGLWLCTQPALAAPHLQTVARTFCKLNGSWQHFTYGLHNFALCLQQSVRSLQPACIRLCVRARILHKAAFGFASGLH